MDKLIDTSVGVWVGLRDRKEGREGRREGGRGGRRERQPDMHTHQQLMQLASKSYA